MIDAYLTRPSYVAHVAAVWRALPAEERGQVYAEHGRNELAPYATDLPWATGRPPAQGGPVIVASGTDTQPVTGSRPVVLLEHGAGQSYVGVDSSGYAGGAGRDRVALFLTPNETVARRNRDRYPNAEHVTCGAPAVDPTNRAQWWEPKARPVVACTFHWRCPVVPETRPAWEHYASAITNHVAAHGEVLWLGHSHPRQAYEFLPWWESIGVATARHAQHVLGCCDLLIADNTSLLYEAARLDIPCVVLDAPWYRPTVEHGLRFWTHADVGIRIARPQDLAEAIALGLEDPDRNAELRRQLAADVFPVVGDEAAHLAAAAITALGK